MEIMPGTQVKVFDSRIFKNDVDTPLSMTMRLATVIRRYGYICSVFGWIYPDVIDVIFDGEPGRISKAHFTECVQTL